MLAVFDRTVAKCPEALKSPNQDSNASSISALKDGSVLQFFNSLHPHSLSVKLGHIGFMAYSSDKQNPLLPRLFTVVDDIFCLFQGHIENIAHLKQQYGLTKTANEVSIIIEAYRTLRDRGPYPADQVVRGISGKFAFVLYDSISKSAFIAGDADGNVPFFWGMDAGNNLVLSDDELVARKACGKSFGPFPKGCFFTSSGGLRSFEYPLKELKSIPWAIVQVRCVVLLSRSTRSPKRNLECQELEVLQIGHLTTDLSISLRLQCSVSQMQFVLSNYMLYWYYFLLC